MNCSSFLSFLMIDSRNASPITRRGLTAPDGGFSDAARLGADVRVWSLTVRPTVGSPEGSAGPSDSRRSSARTATRLTAILPITSRLRVGDRFFMKPLSLTKMGKNMREVRRPSRQPGAARMPATDAGTSGGDSYGLLGHHVVGHAAEQQGPVHV